MRATPGPAISSAINVAGTATLAGNLQVNVTGNSLLVGNQLTILSATSISGNFANASYIPSNNPNDAFTASVVGGNTVVLTVINPLITPTVTVTDNGGTYNGRPFAATNASVTDPSTTNTIAAFGSSTLSYQYFSGSTLLSAAPTNAGTYTVVAQYTSNNANYSNASSSPVSFTISPEAIAVTGSETYNGSTSAAAGILTVSNEITGDNLTLSGHVTLASANAGAESIASFAALTLGGTSSANYTLTGASGSVTVNALAVTLTGSESYNGSTAAAASVLTVTNEISGDNLTLSGHVTLTSRQRRVGEHRFFRRPDARRRVGEQLHVDECQRFGDRQCPGGDADGERDL